MKVSKPFVFKKFTVKQDRCALKVNTDAVLLGALAEAKNPDNIMDIGTGTGVISLMLAQRFPHALIHGVEIESNAFTQTLENYSESPWAERLVISHLPFQEMADNCDKKFDLIVSNPPYYKDHLKTLIPERNIALHSEFLTFDELSEGVMKILSKNGEFFAILPERQMMLLEECLAERGLHPGSKMTILDRPGAQTLRVIQSFGFRARRVADLKEIFIKDSEGNYSVEYATLLRDFLLIF